MDFEWVCPPLPTQPKQFCPASFCELQLFVRLLFSLLSALHSTSNVDETGYQNDLVLEVQPFWEDAFLW